MKRKPTDGNIDRPNRAVTLMVLAALIGSVAIFFGVGTILLLPAIQQAREAKRRQQMANNLKQLSLALESYHDTHKVPGNKEGGDESGQERVPTKTQIEELAIQFKEKWLDEHTEEEIEFKTISSVEKTANGWHVIFESVTLSGEPKGESRQFLHVYIDGNRKLIEVVRGPDETADKE